MANNLKRKIIGDSIWMSRAQTAEDRIKILSKHSPVLVKPEALKTERDVGEAMVRELEITAQEKDGDINIIILGGRGAQMLHKLLGERASNAKEKPDKLISRLHVFTQDAIAPMRMNNSLSFVRDFERLLGEDFFKQVKSFTPMRTDAEDLEEGLGEYLEKMASLGGADIFFMGHGPEPKGASHLAYIKPGSGADAADVAGLISISPSILEHHISKFKAGGSKVSAEDEEECRRATHILTLGPAAILDAKKIVQSVVDADSAPAKKETYRNFLETKFSDNLEERARQLDENPGLWVRMHPNVKAFVLPDVLE